MAPPPAPPKPTTRELSLVLHKWLPNVPKLHVNSDNFHTWVVMVQQALEGTLGYPIVLTDKDLALQSEEDMLLKTALLSTVDDNMKVGVAKSLSGLAGFRLISDTFVLRSLTHHISAMKQLLDLKFDHFDHAANLDTHFWKTNRKTNRSSSTRGTTTTATSSSIVSKWFHKCKVNTHYTRDCSKPFASGSTSIGNTSSWPSNPGANNPFCGATAPPKGNSQANLADLPGGLDVETQTAVPTIQSITLDKANPSVTPEELSDLIEQGGRLFGLDSCTSHTFTNDLSLLYDTTPLHRPLPLNVATNSTKSYVTAVGKMKIKNVSGSITLNNIYYSPDTACMSEFRPAPALQREPRPQ
ncbi:uncharacterized protein VP01_1230g2 [Puccinia sorghi]|uniref:Uncharacterized protein n=1 Tax=Puccinia sorghi TaxID=27349 RepID=A0A0L6VR98_9BASI|nr:uncharacterized protein VP01_1230g2 [Puccinia sorghi]